MFWKEGCKELPNDYQLAEQRLKLIQTRFQNVKNISVSTRKQVILT